MNCEQVFYATLPRRVKATIIDNIILLTLIICGPLAASAIIGRGAALNAVMMFIPILALEPLLITFLGCTIGQYIFGMRVVRNVDVHKKCPLHLSFIRYYSKMLLVPCNIL
jgi:hypothetical protein